MLHVSVPPPQPRDLAELPRITHTRKRRRLLYSQHREDLLELMQLQLGRVRRDAWGEPDLTANPYLSVWEQTARLYSEAPEVSAPDAAGEELLGLAAEAGLWSLMQRVQRDTLALREMLVRVEVVEGQLVYRPVFPDLVEAVARPRRPSAPVAVSEARCDGDRWIWLDSSIADPAAPYYRARSAEGRDITEDVLGQRYEGPTYPWHDAEGAPVLPYAVYHAAETGWLWDPYTLREIVEGALNIGLLLTYYQHIVRNCSWPQRYSVGVGFGGRGERTTDGAMAARQEIVADPAVVLEGEFQEDVPQALIGQWATPADPEAVLRSIAMYERRILLLAGIQPADVTRQEADIRSGYSLAVARESVREAQRVSEPMFRRGDGELLRITAAVLGSTTGRPYPESGYRIVYRGLPPSPVEERAEREEVIAQLGAGLISRPAAYMRLHPGVTEAEARAEIERIARENRATAA